MEKMQFKILIKAPKQKVWETMLNDETYRQWTGVFNPSGSYYEGNWTTGSPMRFLGPNPDGTLSGMYSIVKEARTYDFISIQHLGEIIKGENKPWTQPDLIGNELHENYTFETIADSTQVTVDMDSIEEFREMFEQMWPKALEKLKQISEQDSVSDI